MNKYLKLFLKISVTLGFVTWVVLKTDWNQVLFYLAKIDLWKLFVYIALILLGIAISAYKWKLLSDFKGIRHKYIDYYRYYLTGTFINNFMPSFIGGDTFRAYEIGKNEKKYIEAASSVFADRITGLISMTILALAFSLINFRISFTNHLMLLFNLLIIASLVLDVLVAKTRKFRFWKKIMDRFPEKIARFIIEVQNYSENGRFLTKAINYGMLFQLVGVALANYVLFWSLGIQINLLDYLSVIFLISIVSSFPISVNNIGLKEWAYVTFFGIYGMDGSAMVTAAILSRFIQMLISFLALPTYVRIRKADQKSA
jgi:glycosyltransferase 2 family protein